MPLLFTYHHDTTTLNSLDPSVTLAIYSALLPLMYRRVTTMVSRVFEPHYSAIIYSLVHDILYHIIVE